MTRIVSGVVALLVLAAGFVTPAAAQVGAPEGRPRCNGASVTIHFNDPGVGRIITGTSGVDVIQGGPEGETISSGAGNDIVCAGGGNDEITGDAGADHLRGQGGSDWFVDGDGPTAGLLAADTVVGGAGDRDLADYRGSPVGVVVNQTIGRVTTTGGTTGAISGIERIAGSSHDDVLVARGAGVVNPQVAGSGGDDVVEGLGTGARLSGGTGHDRLTYAAGAAAVQLNAYNHEATFGFSPLFDSFSGFEIYEGTRFADRLVGDDEINHLIGAGGDDVIKGNDGDDILEGNGGDDVLHPGPGDDYIDGGANDPVTSTGEHGDLVSYQGDYTDRDANGDPEEFDAYLMPWPPYHPGHAGSHGVGHDDFAGVESVRGTKLASNGLYGDGGPNVLIGGSAADLIWGHRGNDLLFGLGGADVLEGGADDRVVTNDGDDYLDAGAPNGPDDQDLIDGGDGENTCTGTQPQFYAGCDTIF